MKYEIGLVSKHINKILTAGLCNAYQAGVFSSESTRTRGTRDDATEVWDISFLAKH